ncbi:hypothetical protein [Parasitella parasitica]|uniref:NAD(P)-binding domain-containing protein n=1 Tax=Parasitella parasitica TaxID=35722 RepID=A0A0B7NHP8_9FUNG|nr:hypothetical protein [Parasitella parasitica]
MTASSILITGGTSLVAAAMIRQTHSQSSAKPAVALSRSALPEASASRVHYVRGSVIDATCLQSVLRGNPNVVHTIGVFPDDNSESFDVNNQHSHCDSSITVACTMAGKFDPNKNARKDRRALAFVTSKREAEAALLGIEFRNRIRIVIFRPGVIYSFHRRFGIIPLVFGLFIIGFMARPLRAYIPSNLRFLTDLPLQDDDIANAVFEAIDNAAVEGIVDSDGIRLLAKAWGIKRIKSDLLLP